MTDQELRDNAMRDAVRQLADAIEKDERKRTGMRGSTGEQARMRHGPGKSVYREHDASPD